jgi:hypothetical protein
MMVPAIPPAFSGIPCMLPEGRSPAAWRRAMERAGADATRFILGCAAPVLGRDIAAVLRPRPLFGSALDLLTRGALISERSRPPARVRRVPASLGLPEAPSPPRKSARQAGKLWASPREGAAGCLKQPRKASRQVLERLAGGGAYAASAGERPLRQWPGARPAASAPNLTSTREAPGLLQQRLVARLSRRLGPWAAGLKTAAGVAPLREQWRAVLTGPAAPAELLESGYLNRYQPAADTVPGTAVRDSVDDQGPRPRPRATRVADEAQAKASRRAEPGPRRELDNAGDERGPAAFPIRPPHAIFAGGDDGRPAIPASVVVKPLPEEEGDSQEDLAILSSRLKRILDEEARRHGIDV